MTVTIDPERMPGVSARRFVEPADEGDSENGRYHAAPPPLGVGTRMAPAVAYPPTSHLSETLLWRAYGLDGDL